MMIAISFSCGGIEDPNRTKAPTRWTRSQSSGLRSSALNGPRRPAPRGPDWIASATRFWSAVIVSGVSVENLGSLMAFLQVEHRGGVAMQDLLARFLADLRFRERLGGPLTAEFSAVGAAHDAIGAVQAHRGLDRVRAERVAVHIHLRAADACRRELLFRRVEQTAMIHALDLVRKVPPE